MNLMEELERLTMPAPKASSVRRLSLVEIEQLVMGGEITPIDQVLSRHVCGNETSRNALGRYGRGMYDHGC